VIRSVVELEALGGLTTSYGWVLMAKIAAFLPALVLGGINNRRTKPACVRAAAEGTSTPELGRLRRLVAVEVAMGIVVVGIAAFLVNISSPRTLGGDGHLTMGVF
jgi:putative copper export protein